MDNKPDATNADLPWPNPPLRPNLDGPPLPGTPSSTSSASTPSATIPATAASSSAPDPTGLAPYASDPSANGAPPFPPMDTSWEHRSHHVFFREQTVHQVFFKVFTYENQRKELWINAVNFKGYSRFREPEQYFYFLIGDRWGLCSTHCGLLACLLQHSNSTLRKPSPLRTSKLQPTSDHTQHPYAYTNVDTILFDTKHRHIGSPTSRTTFCITCAGCQPNYCYVQYDSNIDPWSTSSLAVGLQALASSSPSEQNEPPAAG